MYFRQIFDDKLAQYAYLIGCQRTGEALLIDPERDIDRYVEMAREEELEIVAVTETHIHADYLSGAREFAHRHGVKVYLSDEGDADWKYEWARGSDYDVEFLKNGDRFKVGNIEIQAVHTPGHTPEHLSFLITDLGGGADEPIGMVTGDFLFVGDLGRPDLLETAAGQKGAMEPSARRLYRTARGLFDLPEYLQIWPGHGAGSACGKALGAVPETTVGYEVRFNPALRAVKAGEQPFVDFILEGQPEPPPYFARMKKLNKMGAEILGPLTRPRKITGRELSQLSSDDDAVIVDTREDRRAYFDRHIPGSIYAPVDKAMPNVVGSYLNPDQAIYLLVEEAELEDAVLTLVRIGLDNIGGYATPDQLAEYVAAGGELTSIEAITLDETVERQRQGAHVLDVRKGSEFGEGHLPAAQNISHTRLMVRLGELPRDEREVLVYCRTGSRASAAVSFLERKGFRPVSVDDNFEIWWPEHGAERVEEAPATAALTS